MSQILERNLLLPGERSMKVGRNLNGGVYLDLAGNGRVDLRPDQVMKLAEGILAVLGVNVEFEYPGPVA